MSTFRFFVFTCGAALLFTSGVGVAAGAPTRDELVTLEKRAYDAKKSRDARFWDTFLWDRFTGYGPSGLLDKAAAAKEYARTDCEIKSYALSDEQMKPLSDDAALLTYKASVDGTCGGQPLPADTRAASIYVREGDRWKEAFHAGARVVDPADAHPIKVDRKQAPRGEPTNRDAVTGAMLAAEKNVWEAWRVHDGKKLADLTAREISFINIFGTYFANKADALKDWSGTGCDVTRVSLTNAAGRVLSPTAGVLTFQATADGTCYGQNIGPVWGTSVYVKDGEAWKWVFGINLPALR